MTDGRDLCTCGHCADDHVHGASECVACGCDGYRDQSELDREEDEE